MQYGPLKIGEIPVTGRPTVAVFFRAGVELGFEGWIFCISRHPKGQSCRELELLGALGTKERSSAREWHILGQPLHVASVILTEKSTSAFHRVIMFLQHSIGGHTTGCSSSGPGEHTKRLPWHTGEVTFPVHTFAVVCCTPKRGVSNFCSKF